MFSAEGHDGNVGSETLRKSTREKKKAQHFGHSEPSDELEELVSRVLIGTSSRILNLTIALSLLCPTDGFQIEASQPRKIASAVHQAGRQGGKWARGKPSLWISLPLFAQTLLDSSLRHPKKRNAFSVDDHDEFALSTPSTSRERAPKRQCLQQSAPKARATRKSKVVVKAEDDNRLEPRGRPEVWAEVRCISPVFARVLLILVSCDKRCASRYLITMDIIQVPTLGVPRMAQLATPTAIYWTMTMMSMASWTKRSRLQECKSPL